MAMLPFCGYHSGVYFQHWIKLQRTLTETPGVFHVNWFRKDAEGSFLWPGFGEDMRVLQWIVDRVRGRAVGHETPLDWQPRYGDISWSGLDFSTERFQQLQSVDRVARSSNARPSSTIYKITFRPSWCTNANFWPTGSDQTQVAKLPGPSADDRHRTLPKPRAELR